LSDRPQKFIYFCYTGNNTANKLDYSIAMLLFITTSIINKIIFTKKLNMGYKLL